MNFQTEEWQVSSKKKKAAVSAKGSQVGGGGESVGDSTASRSELVLTNDQDKSDHDRSGESVQRGRRERSGPPRFHRGLYYCYCIGFSRKLLDEIILCCCLRLCIPCKLDVLIGLFYVHCYVSYLCTLAAVCFYNIMSVF